MSTSTHELWVFGLSSRTAPAAVREGLAFDPAAALALLRRLAATQPGTEGMVLSTCHRNEFYVVPPAGSGPERFLSLVASAGHCPMGFSAKFNSGSRGGTAHPITWCHSRSGGDAFAHLARVAGGLDSPVLGDAQILGQLRRAAGTATAAGTFGRYLSRSVGAALRVGRQARRETAIGRGQPGIGPAVAAAASGRPGQAVVLGAGEAAQAIGHALRRAGRHQIVFCNRTFGRAAALAGRCGGEARPWDALPALLASADVVVAATAAPLPVIGPWSLARRTVMPLVVDAGFPRQVSPLAGTEVVRLDALQAGATEALSVRQAAVPQVEALVATEVAAWQAWEAGLPREAAIKALWLEADAFCRQVGADRSTRAAVRRSLHHHTLALRQNRFLAEAQEVNR